MTLRHSIETNNDVPTDDSLVDYLMGETADSDRIERWLAVDESHLLRLERLAEVMCAIATKPAVINPAVVNPAVAKPIVAKRFLVGLAAIAASIALIAVWSRNQEPDQRLTNDRLALMWVDVVSGEDVTHPLVVDWHSPWPADADAMPADTAGDSASAWSDDEPIVEGEFASGDDSPPQWLLVAVSQMTDESSADPDNGFDSDVLDEDEVR